MMTMKQLRSAVACSASLPDDAPVVVALGRHGPHPLLLGVNVCIGPVFLPDETGAICREERAFVLSATEDGKL